MDNSNRRDELMKLRSYTEEIDNELTMILQTLQWDRNHLLQNPAMMTCRYDSNHKVPPERIAEHEKECFLRKNGYSKDDQLLPDPLDSESNTLVKLEKEDIHQIIANASKSDTSFRKVYRKIMQVSEPAHPLNIGCRGAEPMSLERLQISYTADERRAIHDAVVSAVPSCHDLTDLMLPTTGEDKNSKLVLSRKEILLELRNMRRRRTKYRVAAKSRNYSDVLRDVIRTQMEHFNEGKSTTTEAVEEETDPRQIDSNRRDYRLASQERDRYSQDRHKTFVPRPIKIEVTSEEGSSEKNREYSRDQSYRASRYESGSRDRGTRDGDRKRDIDRFRDKRNDDDIGRDRTHGEYSRKRRHDDDSRHETRDKRYYYEGNKEKKKDKDNWSHKRSKRRYENEDDVDYRVQHESGQCDDPDKEQRYKERRSDEKKDKTHKHKERNHHAERHKDRERSRDQRSDHRHEERNSERMYIKQEREDSVTQDDRRKYERERNRKHYDKAYKDRNYDGHSAEMDRKKFPRYYDIPSQEIYDPNKAIKQEK